METEALSKLLKENQGNPLVQELLDYLKKSKARCLRPSKPGEDPNWALNRAFDDGEVKEKDRLIRLIEDAIGAAER